MKRLVLDPHDRERPRTTCRTTKQATKTNEFGGSIGGPIVQATGCFFYGAYSPRNQQRTNNYNFADGTNGDIPRDTWNQQAFGKVSFASRRFNAGWSALWTPTTVTGTLSAYNGADAELADLDAGGAGAEHHARLRAEPGQHERHGGHHADQRVVPERPRRHLPRPLHRHGHLDARRRTPT